MMPSDAPRDRLLLRGLFVLALLVRLWFVLVLHPTRAFLFSDMQSYDTVALELLLGQQSVWHAFRPVGYSFFLAFVYALTDGSRTFVGVLQACMGAALAPLTVKLALAAGVGRCASFLAGAAVAGSVPLLLYCGLLLTEVPSAFFLLLGLCLLVRPAESPGSGALRLLQAGLALGLGAAIRPNFLLTFPILALYAWARAGSPLRKRLTGVLALTLGVALPVALVCAYNSSALGRLTGPSANGGLNFYLNFADVHTIRYEGPFGMYWISPVPNGFDHTRVEVTPVPLFEDRYYYARGMAVLRAQPGTLLEALRNFPEAAGVGRQLLWPHWPGHEQLLQRYALLFFALVLVPALLASAALLAAAPRNRTQREALTVAALCLSSALPIYFFLGDPRLRVPFDPLFTVLAALAYERTLSFLVARFPRRS